MAVKTYTLRIEEKTLDKLHYIANYYGRSANGQMLFMIRQLIEEFEKTHGEIKIERHSKKKDQSNATF